MQEFEFTYLTNKTQVTLSDTFLKVKIGLIIKKELLLDSINFFYIKEYSDYNELIINYRKQGGKVANLKLIHGKGILGALELINALSQKYPEKDLRGKNPNEAMKMMKATNSQKLGFWMAFVIMIFVVSIFFVPYLMHYFDGGHANINVEDIIENEKIGTRNVTIEGVVLNAGLWEQTNSEDSSSVITENNYFPIVEDNWQGEDPVYVVLKTGFLTQDEVDSFVYNSPSFTGIMRNIWWEGLEDKHIDFFMDEYNLKIADKVIMIEVGDDGSDFSALMVYAGILFILIIIFIIIGIRQKRMA